MVSSSFDIVSIVRFWYPNDKHWKISIELGDNWRKTPYLERCKLRIDVRCLQQNKGDKKTRRAQHKTIRLIAVSNDILNEQFFREIDKWMEQGTWLQRDRIQVNFIVKNAFVLARSVIRL